MNVGCKSHYRVLGTGFCFSFSTWHSEMEAMWWNMSPTRLELAVGHQFVPQLIASVVRAALPMHVELAVVLGGVGRGKEGPPRTTSPPPAVAQDPERPHAAHGACKCVVGGFMCSMYVELHQY